ncbi:MAG TPA: NADH-quinone oxidoreductase subunit L, partial [Dehalococcoidia bacterium]
MLGMEDAWLLPAIPAAAFAVLALFRNALPRKGDWLGIAAILASFLLFFPVLADALDNLDSLPFVRTEEWFAFDGFQVNLGIYVDQLTLVMLAVVTFVALMVNVYSVGYMHGDQRYGWFYAVLALFAASMLTLVLSSNLLLLYVAWELVGFCSFLLIGFWWERRSAAEASKKAFVTTRVGDVGLLIGIIMLWRAAGTFEIQGIFEAIEAGEIGETYLTAALLLMFLGAMGKSAQVPLHVWLPDAMEGPTPVSALIHAATMVVAGVYLVARMLPAFEAVPSTLDVVLVVGTVTTLFAALVGLVQTDIKRVIAYSTINSLGLMFVALGAGSVTAAMLYLFVHGYFKALLFLGSGSVIHATERQDVNELGGLAAKMPVTTWTFVLGALAMAGIPPLSGFWAKDEIILATSERHVLVYGLILVSVVLTALYMT